MLEVQQAAMGSEARSRLDTMRAELGLPSAGGGALGAGSAAELGTGTTPLSDPALDAPAATPAEAGTDQADRQG